MERKSWECHRCGKVNAPHADQCGCPGFSFQPLYPTYPIYPIVPIYPTYPAYPPITWTCDGNSTSIFVPGCN